MKDIQHALLRILRADLDHLLAVGDGGFYHAFELDVGFDELDRAICASSDGLRGCAGKPVNHGAAGNQSKEERSVEQRKLIHVFGEAAGERHDDGENHGGCADNGRADEHRLRGGFEGVARAVIGFEQMFGAFEVDGVVEIFLEFRFDVWNLFDQRKLVNGLRVISDWAVGIDCDGHRSHTEEAEGNESEGEDRGSEHGRGRRQVPWC